MTERDEEVRVEGGAAEGEGAPVAAAGPAIPGGSYETAPPGGHAGTEAPREPNEPVFEPDVPLVAEVNRELGKGPPWAALAVAGLALALLGLLLARRRA